jgi:hypothetical protein
MSSLGGHAYRLVTVSRIGYECAVFEFPRPGRDRIENPVAAEVARAASQIVAGISSSSQLKRLKSAQKVMKKYLPTLQNEIAKAYSQPEKDEPTI